MIAYLLEKEFKQIFRNSFLPKLLIMFPIVAILVFPWAANQEIEDIRVCMVDHDRSSLSGRLTEKIAASNYFILESIAPSYEEAMQQIEAGDVDIILEIEAGFERKFFRNETAQAGIASNAVNGMKGSLAASYMQGLVQDYKLELQAGYMPATTLPASLPQLTVLSQNRYNPYLDYKVYMVPAIMVLLITLLCGFLPSLNIVGEKESGSIEQINVTPINKFVFILSKLIPYWIIGFSVLTVGMIVAALVYGLMPAGNLLTIYFFATVYILAVSGIGIIISNHSSTMQQAMFVMFFFLIIMILTSGLFTPVSGMPAWAKLITDFNPLRYYIEVMRMVYLKGSSIAQLSSQLFALLGFALAFNAWAVLSYRKSQ